MPSPPPASHDQFLRLIAEHQAGLHTFIRSMLPTREEASTVLQDVMVVLWQKFETAQDFKKWAYGVARLEVLKFIQTRRRDRHIFDDELVNRLADEAMTHEERHLTQREALEGCLQKLPAPQRDLVLTAYTKGTRMDDLAIESGQTPMALYKLLQRTRQALLACVQRSLNQEASEPA
ncbi:MAG: sigma-70 family RNA polymerase sigma factor [Verrucomicrobium sp.]